MKDKDFTIRIKKEDFPKIRKKWAKNPSTKIEKDKKSQYDRSDFKRGIEDALEELDDEYEY